MFNSFLMAGYECADHINRSGNRINLLTETAHDIKFREDYRLLKQCGILTVREGICWSFVETAPFEYDFTNVKNRINAAEEMGIQQIWEICHFGFPTDLTPTHPKFTERFVSVCKAFVNCYNSCTKKPLFIIPINEISFLSWHAGDVRGTVPFSVNSGFDIKYHLCKAAIAGIKAIKAMDPSSIVILSEPLIKIHPPIAGMMTEEVSILNEHQFQAMDIITGRMCKELHGNDGLVDIVGCNYYYNNQWEHNGQLATWPELEPRRSHLSALLMEVVQRYNKPIIITETGHFGQGRAQWFKEIISECLKAINYGVNLLGVCLYPIIDRPDWDNLNWYHNSGLWDIDPNTKERIIHDEYLKAIREFTNSETQKHTHRLHTQTMF